MPLKHPSKPCHPCSCILSGVHAARLSSSVQYHSLCLFSAIQTANQQRHAAPWLAAAVQGTRTEEAERRCREASSQSRLGQPCLSLFPMLSASFRGFSSVSHLSLSSRKCPLSVALTRTQRHNSEASIPHWVPSPMKPPVRAPLALLPYLLSSPALGTGQARAFQTPVFRRFLQRMRPYGTNAQRAATAHHARCRLSAAREAF